MSDGIQEKVIRTLASVKRMPESQISLDAPLQSLGVDSLDTFTLLFELEEQFRITIPDEQARSIRTVKDIVEGIRQLLETSPAEKSVTASTPAD